MAGRFRGVTRRGNGWQISFVLSSVERCREILRFPETRRGEEEAHRFRAMVLLEIDKGTFDYALHFPRSKRALRHSPSAGAHISVKRALSSYLDERKPYLALSTYRDYAGRIQKHLIPAFGHFTLSELTPRHVREWLDSTASSNKAKNNVLIPLRGMYRRAFEDEMIERDPLTRVRPLPIRSREADPFNKTEIRSILAELGSRSVEAKAYFQFAFATGLRTSELLALTWNDVDLLRRRVFASKARVRGVLKPPKTAAGRRTVSLSPVATAALQCLNRRANDLTIFCDPLTGDPWKNDQKLRKQYWYPALVKLGIRKRNPYQTRHTYASELLSKGENPLYVAAQMGHTDWGMIRKVYGRFIQEEHGTNHEHQGH
jgi:integrase